MGHFAALGPLTSPNLNISTIWVRDPWVPIQINFWGFLPLTKEVPHRCKIVTYFYLPIYFGKRGAKLSGNGCKKGARGGQIEGQIRWSEGDGTMGWGKGGNMVECIFK